MQLTDISHSEEIYTVTRLNREIRYLLEGSFPLLWLEGEISNFVAASSGHWYFSLKDTNAQVRCAMFKPHNRKLSMTPKDGMQVIAKARVSLYEGRGEYQLLIETMDEAGTGQLQKAFEALKKRLSEQGLFDPTHKKPLPALPQCIGVITSPTGAAIRDILHVLKRRYPCVPIIIYPTLVQGQLAAGNIVAALNTANARKECDVLILARGGGSIEDLWPFNEEIVAHAIFQSNIPIVSGVGHEIDFTIADFVADFRAPTPSAAAECVTPLRENLLATLKKHQQQILRCMLRTITQKEQTVKWLTKHLQSEHPKHRLIKQTQTLDHLESQLIRLTLEKLNRLQSFSNQLSYRLQHQSPARRILEQKHYLILAYGQLKTLMQKSLHSSQQQFLQLTTKLDALSPLATLKRGYAIVSNKGKILTSIKQIKIKEKMHIQFLDGAVGCTVDDVIDH